MFVVVLRTHVAPATTVSGYSPNIPVGEVAATARRMCTVTHEILAFLLVFPSRVVVGTPLYNSPVNVLNILNILL